MKPLLIVNFERVEASPFIVALLYDETGGLIDGVTLPGGDVYTALQSVQLLADAHCIIDPEVWTSDTGLYLEMLSRPGVLGFIKHPSETRQTRRHIEQDAELLRKLYEIQPLEPKQKAPRWRVKLMKVLRAITLHLKGDYEYDNN